MPLPCPSGQISLADIQNEFGGSNPTSINEYYANGGLVPAGTGTVPTSGQISFADFFCATSELTLIISATTTNLNLQTAFDTQFGANTWTNSSNKRVIINPGVIVGSTSICNYALTVSSGRGGTLKIDNYGSIQGAGGAANSGMGGNAILANSSVSINNQGSIYAGGGGGGVGGAGGTGYYYNDTSTSACLRPENSGNTPGCPGGYYETGFSQGGCCQTYNYCCGLFNCACVGCASYQYTRYCRQDVYTSGSPGGTGGTGQGYGQNATAGSGSYYPGGNAGTGGTGGNGGAFGQSGSAGNGGSSGNVTGGSGGGPAGLAGYYIVNNQNVTWTNLGTVAGRTSTTGILEITITSTTVDFNLETAFNNTYGYQTWYNPIAKRVTINPGVVVGGTGSYALTIPSSPCNSSLDIINYGYILGAGGATNGANGGNAIYAGSPVTINNQGYIYAGGGAGGNGGTGGMGYDYYYYSCNCYEQCDEYCCNTCCGKYGCGCCGTKNGPYYCYNCYTVCGTCSGISYYGGGAGGAGGSGQGYSTGPGVGSPGGAGGPNAGYGGYGGNGGAWGQPGTAGGYGYNGNYSAGSPGQPGGQGGYYIVNNGNVTWAAYGSLIGGVA